MKYTVKESTPVKHIVEIEVPAEEFDVCYAKSLKEIAEVLEIPGFRKGKVPQNMIEQHVDQNHILSKTTESIISKNWIKYLEESGIEAVSQPEVEIIKIAKGNPFIFTASVEILSNIALPDVKKLTEGIKKEKIEITSKEIEDAILWLRNARAVLTDKEGPAEKNDFIEFSFQIENLPDTFSHMRGEQKDGYILGKEHFINGLESAIIGTKAGDEKEFEGTIDQHIDKLQPEKMPVKVKVKIISVQKMDLPEITNEWVKTLGRFETVDALKKDIQKGLEEEKRVAGLNRLRVEAMDKILEKTKLEIPAILLRREEDNLLENLKDRVNYELKISLEEYLSQIKKTEDDMKKEFEKIALDRVKRFLILHQIAKNEKIIATDEEVANKLEEVMAQYPKEEKEKIDVQRLAILIADDITKEKIFAFLGLN
ncbi:MAG: trigger factor [Candidatus Paceibacterota bacterium]|jgi:trigger factor|nr:trigger factor [bacterium]